MNDGLTPAFIQCCCGLCHAALVSTAIADHNDVFEAMRLQTASDVVQDHFKCFVSEAKSARIAHVSRRFIKAAFRDEFYDWSTECRAEVARDPFTSGLQNVIVFTEG